MCQVGRAFWLVEKEDQGDPQNDLGNLSAQSYKDVIQKIQDLPAVHRPSKKREALKEIYDLTNKTIMNFYDRRARKAQAVMVDNLIPILEFLIIRSGVPNIGAEIDFIRKTMPNSCVNGITGFMTTTFSVCLDLIEKADYKSFIINKVAAAESEKSPEALRRAFYESFNAPGSFMNTILLEVVKKHPVWKGSGSDSVKLSEFVKARDTLEAKTRDSLKSDKLKLTDRVTLQRACRDAIVNINYNCAMEAFERDNALKVLNIRINSEIQRMKESVTFEMIDSEHRKIDFDMTKLVAAAAAFGDRRRSISERMRSLYDLGVLAGKEGKSGAVGLALIRAGVQNLCTQVYLFNTVAITGAAEEGKAVRILVEAERAVKHVNETWWCTEEVRKTGWKRTAVIAAVRRLVGTGENRYGRVVAKAQKKVLEAPRGKSVAESVKTISENVAREVLCGCPESALGEGREAVYNVVEMAIIEPNYVAMLGLFSKEAEEADTLMHQKICALKGAMTPKMLGLNVVYCGCGEEDVLGEEMAHRYVNAVKGIENMVNDKVRKSGCRELQILKEALDAIAKTAAVVSERPVSRVERDSITKILCFVVVHREVKGLHGHVLFMEAFLSGNKKCGYHLSILKEALKLVETLTQN